MTSGILAAICYFIALALIAFFTRNLAKTGDDFAIGGRSVSFYLTALGAHASDASSWLFLGLPGAVFLSGMSEVWMALGLLVFMAVNWHFIAPRLRELTAATDSVTLSTFFSRRMADEKGTVRFVTALMLFVYYGIYIASGMIGLGVLLGSLFGIPYQVALIFGLFLVVPFLLVGGFLTLAWTDFFQGLFLLGVILVVPLYSLGVIGGWSGLTEGLAVHGGETQWLPEFTFVGILTVLFTFLSWGPGYFGQPHILTKFMGIGDRKELSKAKVFGLCWQLLTLGGAVLTGLVALVYFQGESSDPQTVFISLCNALFPPFLAGIFLCGILAATISTLDSQILVLASSLAEDFYVPIFRRQAGQKEVLWFSRVSVGVIGFLGYAIAVSKPDSIFGLVQFAWFGLGSAFGPIVIASLYFKKVKPLAASLGILVGGVLSALWPLFGTFGGVKVPPLVVTFPLGLLIIYLGSRGPQAEKVA